MDNDSPIPIPLYPYLYYIPKARITWKPFVVYPGTTSNPASSQTKHFVHNTTILSYKTTLLRICFTDWMPDLLLYLSVPFLFSCFFRSYNLILYRARTLMFFYISIIFIMLELILILPRYPTLEETRYLINISKINIMKPKKVFFLLWKDIINTSHKATI